MLVIGRVTKIIDYISRLPVLQVCIGIIAGALFPWQISLTLGTVLLVLSMTRRIKGWLGVGLVLVSLSVFLSIDTLPSNHISVMNDDTVMIKGIADEVVSTHEKLRLVIRVEKICVQRSEDVCIDWEHSVGKVQTWVSLFPVITEGQRLVLAGELSEPEDFDAAFSYVDYLESQQIFSVMYRPDVEILEGERSMAGKYLFSSIRVKIQDKINSNLPEPHAALLSGMLLGVRRGMPEDFSEDLRRTGTTHIIAASGYNVAIVARGISVVFSFLRRNLRILVSVLCIWLFVMLAGGTPPVVRAGVMGSITMLGSFLGHMTVIHVGLPISAAVMILLDPGMLTDLSFQLSFMSTAGLVYLVPVFMRFFPWIPESLQEGTVVGISASIMTAPLIAYTFGSISILSPLANTLVLPTIQVVMLFGALLIIVPGFIGIPLRLVAVLVWVPLEYFVRVVTLVSDVSYASADIGGIPRVSVFVAYFIIFIGILLLYPDTDKEHIGGLSL